MDSVFRLGRQLTEHHVRVGHFTVFRFMHRNHRQGEDDFIFDHRQQIDFAVFIDVDRLVNFRQCFSLLVIGDRTETIRYVEVMLEWLITALALQRYANVGMPTDHSQPLIVD